MCNSSVIISQHVINSIKALPESDRRAVAIAIADEMILGNNPDENLSPFQAMLYSIIQFYIARDSSKAATNKTCDKAVAI